MHDYLKSLLWLKCYYAQWHMQAA